MTWKFPKPPHTRRAYILKGKLQQSFKRETPPTSSFYICKHEDKTKFKNSIWKMICTPLRTNITHINWTFTHKHARSEPKMPCLKCWNRILDEVFNKTLIFHSVSSTNRFIFSQQGTLRHQESIYCFDIFPNSSNLVLEASYFLVRAPPPLVKECQHQFNQSV